MAVRDTPDVAAASLTVTYRSGAVPPTWLPGTRAEAAALVLGMVRVDRRAGLDSGARPVVVAAWEARAARMAGDGSYRRG